MLNVQGLGAAIPGLVLFQWLDLCDNIDAQ